MNSATIQELAQRLQTSKAYESRRFVFFLGAGASESSGIPTASWIVRDFERQLKALWRSEDKPGSFATWLQSKPGWKSNDSRYAQCFEAHEPSEHGRIRYLNKWMQAASPGWGYFCLAQLIAGSYISTVVTSNFDDLIYESCTQNSVRRPRVYSMLNPDASTIELDYSRPTIIKLHGDFLYQNIRNTSEEVRELNRRLMTKVSEIFETHEIIVAGYSGTDDRIMQELFAQVPRANAVYWCTYRDENVPERVQDILKQEHRRHAEHWFEVATTGFDDFMDELFNLLGFSIPGIIQPIQATIDAIPGRIEGSNSPHAQKYLRDAIKQVQAEEKSFAQARGDPSVQGTPYRLRLEAMLSRMDRDYGEAVKKYEQLIRLPNQDTCQVLIEYAVTLELMDEYSKASDVLSRIEQSIERSDDLGNYGWLLANLGMYDQGIRRLKQAIEKAPGARQWQTGLALVMSEKGLVRQALKECREFTRMNPADSNVWATLSTIESLAGDYEKAASHGEMAKRLDPKGFFENLSLALATSGAGDHAGAVRILEQPIDQDDDILYRCLGHFQILTADVDSAVKNLARAVHLAKPAKRPKTTALHGVALLAQGTRAEAMETFEAALAGRTLARYYKADDELSFALCELAVGHASGLGKIKALSKRYRAMRGLLLELSALLDVIGQQGIEHCDEAIASIGTAIRPVKPELFRPRSP